MKNERPNLLNDQLAVLFEPLVMRNLTLKNRFFMAPMGTTFNLERLKDYLTARAKGDVALITTPEISIHRLGRAGMAEEPRLEEDSNIKDLVPLVKAVQKAGAKIVAQKNHTGRYAFGRLSGHQSVAPSAIASKYTGEMPRELSTAEADELVLSFARAAVRARKCGFDGIELCASSGYLISQFLSPLTNCRDDKYGGSFTKRALFLLSIIRMIREMVGDDFNICVKFDAEDGMEGGKTLEDSLILAPLLVEAGADRLHVWAGWHESSRPMLPMSVPRGAFSYLAAEIKKVVTVPVATVGRINDPYTAAEIIMAKRADMVGLGRTLLCDPDFVLKTKEGRTREIRRCIACCLCFDEISKAIRGDVTAYLRCALNPELGHEGEGLIKPAEIREKILVAGGGPAGLEAARIVAMRGHQVTLIEKEEKLGGMINLAVLPPHKEELKNIIDYYLAEMEALGVKVKMGEDLTGDTINQVRPDAVVLAIGASAQLPSIPGVEKKHVVTALNVLAGRAEVKQRVVVVGGGLIGLETAEYLADRGVDVTVVEMLKTVGADIGATTRWGLLTRLRKKVKVMTLSKVIEIRDQSVLIEGDAGQEIPADTVVIATGLQCNSTPDFLAGLSVPVYKIGCCRNPGQIMEAVADGFETGRRL